MNDDERTPARSFDQDFDPDKYLTFYYSGQVNEDEKLTYRYVINYLKGKNHHFSHMLEVGCGPTLHNVMPFAPYVDDIHMADYLPSNLVRIQQWLDDKPGAHNWDTYLNAELALEDHAHTLSQRKQDLRRKITKLKHIDLRKADSLGDGSTYPLVTAFYCAASATSSKQEWKQFMNGIINLVSPGGTLMVSDFRFTEKYHVGNTVFPNAHIDEQDMLECLSSHPSIARDSIDIQPLTFGGWENEGLSGFMIATALTNQ